jgi:hypothetical protein
VGGKELKNVCPFVGMMAAKNTALEILDGPNLSIAKEMLPPPILWPNKMTCKHKISSTQPMRCSTRYDRDQPTRTSS